MSENLTILASESLGVRSMAAVVYGPDFKLVIDPGLALAPRRFRLGPSRQEEDAAARVQRALRNELNGATHVVITHFHGDHHPMVDADASQMSAQKVSRALGEAKLFSIGKKEISKRQTHRKYLLEKLLGKKTVDAGGQTFGPFAFSPPVPHGEGGQRSASVLMVLADIGDATIAHGSDIQLLDDQPVDILCDWAPEVLFVGGPPVYLLGNRTDILDAAANRLRRLATACGTVVVDHHVMRSDEGAEWLNRQQRDLSNVCSAAEFMGKEPSLLEAHRKVLSRKPYRRR